MQRDLQMAQTTDDFSTYSSLMQNKEFLSLKTNKERIEFILNFIRPLSVFRKYVHQRADQYLAQHMKSAEKSLNFREKGIKYNENKDYKNAVLMFTKVSQLLNPFQSQ